MESFRSSSRGLQQKHRLLEMHDRASTSMGKVRKGSNLDNERGRNEQPRLDTKDKLAETQNFHVHPPYSTGYIPPACRKHGREAYLKVHMEAKLRAQQKHMRYLEAKTAAARPIITREVSVPIRSAVNTSWLDTNLMRDTFI